MLPSSSAKGAAQWDKDSEYIKLAVFDGERVELEVVDGCVSVSGTTYHVSFNLPEGSRLRGVLVPQRDKSYAAVLCLYDIVRFGKLTDLSPVSFKSRYEVLTLVCSPFPDEYGFRLFGGRCVAPHTFVMEAVSASAVEKCQDPRVIGFEAFKANSLNESALVLRGSKDDDGEGVDGIERFPPVSDESKRVIGYKPLVRSMIRKMTGKWRDVYLRKHQPSLLPFDYEDLMQFGLMQVTIALRKYQPDNKWKAKEATFVYQHLWHRFGQIAHKYSKQSRGYGVHHVRDFIDDEGKLVSAYDAGGGQEDESY